MVPTATTVGGFLQTLPPDRRVAMARVCSLIRRNARGVHESMRYGLAFYEYEMNPLFALEPGETSMTLYIAEPKVLENYEGKERLRENQPVPGQDELLKIWQIKAEAAAVPPPIIHIPVAPAETEQKE